MVWSRPRHLLHASAILARRTAEDHAAATVFGPAKAHMLLAARWPWRRKLLLTAWWRTAATADAARLAGVHPHQHDSLLAPMVLFVVGAAGFVDPQSWSVFFDDGTGVSSGLRFPATCTNEPEAGAAPASFPKR